MASYLDEIMDMNLLGSAGEKGGYNPGALDYGFKLWNMYDGWQGGKDEKEMMEKIYGLKETEMMTNLAMKEASAYDAMNNRNRNLAGWGDLGSNPGKTEAQRGVELGQRIDQYNTTQHIVGTDGGTTDLIPNGIIPGQYQPTVTPATAPVGNQPSSATVAATAAKPVTQPGTNSQFNNKKRPNTNNAYIG